MKNVHRRRLAYLATVAAGLTTTVVAAGAAQAATAPTPSAATSSISVSAHHTLGAYAAGIGRNSPAASELPGVSFQNYYQGYMQSSPAPPGSSASAAAREASAAPLGQILRDLG